MAALVQYPQQSGSVTMLQQRGTPTSGYMPPPQGQSGQQYMASQPRAAFQQMPAYRGAAAPIQPYAFTSTPSLNTVQWNQGTPRTHSSPAVPTGQQPQLQPQHQQQQQQQGRDARTTLGGGSMVYNPTMGVGKSGSRDDSSIPQARTVTPAPRPQSAYMSSSPAQVTFAQAVPVKSRPDRYRRTTPPAHGRVPSAGSSAPSSASTGSQSQSQSQSQTRQAAAGIVTRPDDGQRRISGPSVDDMQLTQRSGLADASARRLRRRSMHTLDSADYPKPLTPQGLVQPAGAANPLAGAAGAGAGAGAALNFGDLATSSLRVVNASVNAPANGGEDKMMAHSRSGSSSSVASASVRSTAAAAAGSSRPSSANRNVNTKPASPEARSPSPASAATPNSTAPNAAPTQSSDAASSQDYPRLVNIPPRGSSSDVGKRITTPSPLSQPTDMADEVNSDSDVPSAAAVHAAAPAAPTSPAVAQSPAAQQLAAISQKGTKSKSKTSRLRRAFSFGSAADFRKAAGPDDDAAAAAAGDKSEPARLHKEPSPAELYDAEQARIAQKQEEGGIGSSIYGARLFSGSTDNLSISSTASSASVMIRKMGRGVKRGTRSLAGLFRPKSIVGAPSAEAGLAPPEASTAAVSMINVEAERDLVNVNANPHDVSGGGTGFPHLERNSMDTAQDELSDRLGSAGTDNSARKSIVGGDRERAEVLAAVRKGILKHSSRSSSPASRPADGKTNPTTTPADLPGARGVAMTESPSSSAPSTPRDDGGGVQGGHHKRSESVTIGNEDYFVAAMRLRQDTKSAPVSSPGTPHAGMKRSATFSPRIVFHDTWPSGEYDRRGEIATCNRLTPMLAQQIKEELNTFKMEMEVHENSKIYTHFF